MYRPTGKTWTLAELQDLFTEYFHNKLSPTEIDRLAEDCAVALDSKARALEDVGEDFGE